MPNNFVHIMSVGENHKQNQIHLWYLGAPNIGFLSSNGEPSRVSFKRGITVFPLHIQSYTTLEFSLKLHNFS